MADRTKTKKDKEKDKEKETGNGMEWNQDYFSELSLIKILKGGFNMKEIFYLLFIYSLPY